MEADEREEGGRMSCISCKDHYTATNAGTCRECYEEASETEEELKKEIEELKAKISFLKTWAPQAVLDRFSDVLLQCSDGSSIRAHKAVLVVHLYPFFFLSSASYSFSLWGITIFLTGSKIKRWLLPTSFLDG